LNNAIYDNSCVNGDFSHSYIIVNEYFDLMLEMQKKSQNEFQWIIKHVFWQYYFLHMWPTSKTKHFWTHLTFFFIKWFKKWILCLVAFFFKISKLLNFCMIWFFIEFIQWTWTFIESDMFLLYKFFEINCMILCIPFDSLKKKCTSLNTWLL